MVGKYSSSTGLILDFGGDQVTLDCGPAHVKQPYTVENTPTQLLVHVQNSGGPFTLAVAPDNSLRGAGATTVNGRLVTGMNGDNVTYRPSSQQCGIATLTPASANSTTSIAANTSAITPPAAPAPNPTTGPGLPAATPASSVPVTATTPSTPGPKAAMRVIITAQFPAGSNPMAGQEVFLMHERMDEVLRKLGIPVPPNSTPGKAMQILGATCKSQNCGPVVTGMTPYYITGAKLDATGKAMITSQSAATGSYYFFAVIRTPSGSSYVWDIPTTLAPGDNTITLTPSNAEVIQ
jgi:hypothetical protein